MAITTPVPTGALETAGLPAEEVAGWASLYTTAEAPFERQWEATEELLGRGQRLLERLPARPRRSEDEQAAAAAIANVGDEARVAFLRPHAEELYARLTEEWTRPLRDSELVFAAAERFPGLAPTREEMAAELGRPLAEKEGIEIAQGLLLAYVLSAPAAGGHLVHTMLRPTPEALERIEEFRSSGLADLGEVEVRRQGKAGILELRNPRHLNAEDENTLPASEVAVDLILLDPEIEVGVLRGGVVEHPRYEGRRIFGAGLNLTRLYKGSLPFMFFVTRDLGYVNKIYRGLSAPEFHPAEPEQTTEKLWIACAETYAIGGACQLLHVVDHVIAERGCRLYLPARKEGIIPGASNLRLPRFVGDRLARQAIVSGLEFEAGVEPAQLICDETVEPGEVDAALAARLEALTSSGLVNAAANRRALRIGEEPIEVFRQYMATFAKEQAHCHLSPALVANLEEHWNAHQRSI